MELLLNRLQVLFPPDDCLLLAVIVVMPLLGAIINGLFGKRLGNEAVTLMALASVAISLVASVVAFVMLAGAGAPAAEVAGEHGPAVPGARFVWHGWEWLSVSYGHNLKHVPIEVAFSLDALSAVMTLVITGVGFLIHVYSTKYMEGDPGYYRFFAYLNLFIFSMLVLVLGDNLPMLFIGWEGVGLCSYLLIGFWYEDTANAAAGRKAFITNRIGDFGLLVAMAMLVAFVGALDWSGIEAGRSGLLRTVQIWPIGHHVPFTRWMVEAPWAASLFGPERLQGWYEVITAPRHVGVSTLVGLSLFLGCAGKSAQIPLYVWLPDAMAGPTPVSALIHAATMVTAGVYLVCRLSPVFVLSPAAMFTMALVGAVTAVFAATIALGQRDIKKVLAYSTVSQLGYMFLGVGVGAFSAGLFHVVTHAFFKACLFLGAGSVIHALHVRIHGGHAQDLGNMGGLARYLPVTFWTFLAAVLCIAGVPGTSGFFSKDEILFRAWTGHIGYATEGGVLPAAQDDPFVMFAWPEWAGDLLFGLGVAGAVLTAFYMGRLLLGIFWGEFRGWRVVSGSSSESHEHDGQGAVPRTGPEPRESPWQMTMPLVILAALAVFAGFLNPHQLGVVSESLALHPFDTWLAPVVGPAETFGQATLIAHPHDAGKATLAVGISIGAAVLGLFVAYWIYVMQRGAPAQQLREAWPRLHRAIENKWYVDEIYEETIIGAVHTLAEIAVWFDRWVVDGIVAGVTSTLVKASGAVLRLVQTGRVQVYATVMVAGVIGLGWFYAAPQVAVQTFADPGTGAYRLRVAPGLGYTYRWDKDGDGHWDAEPSELVPDLSLTLEPGEKRTVRVQVKNAFGLTRSRTIELERASGGGVRQAYVVGGEP